MKRIVFVLLIAVRVFAASAGGLDARSRLAVSSGAPLSRAGDHTHVPLIAKLSDESGMEVIERSGAVVMGRREMLVLCCVPVGNLEMFSDAEGIVTASVTSEINMALDYARAISFVDDVAAGSGLPSGLTGKGVVTGFCDTGFDPLHSAFEGRVRQMTVYDTFYGLRYTPDEANSIEARENYHATHVAGILAGGHTSSPYTGAAPDADIVATMSDLTDVGILAGIDDIISYAREHGKPAVVNISLASETGPRDGTSLFNQYTDLQSREAIIVISAGNSGRRPCSLAGVLDPASPVLSTAITTWDVIHLNGNIDIWSSNDEPLELSFGVFDGDTRSLVASSPKFLPGADVTSLVELWPAFSQYFGGTLQFVGEVNSQNSRFNVPVNCDYKCKEKSQSGEWGRYKITLNIHGCPMTEVSVFTDGNALQLGGIAEIGCKAGNPDCSINDLACGRNIIAVGMTDDRAVVPLLGGDSYDGSFATGVISPNSSYGVTFDGRCLPHISAPGNLVVSAASGPYVAAHPDALRLVAATPGNGHEDYWCATGGTSMSSPLVAGIIASWLEADPDITVGRARAILRATSRHDMPDASDPRYGSGGVVDALAGAKAIVNGSSLPDVGADSSKFCFDGVRVSYPEALSIEIISPDGVRVGSASGDVADCSAMARGVYIVRAVTPAGVTAAKMALLH